MDEVVQVHDHQVDAFAGAVVVLQLLIAHQGSCFGVDQLVASADLEDRVVPDLAPSPEFVLQGAAQTVMAVVWLSLECRTVG